jgi:putative transcriptional regulator
MTPSHHLPEDVLLDYGAGTGDEARALVAATHLALCTPCRDELERLEAVGGALFDSVREGASVGDDLFEKIVARLDEPAPPAPRAPELEGAEWLPAPLRPYVADAGGLRWERVLPGVRQLVLAPRMGEREVRLVEFKPGLTLGQHTHGGVELNVVLTGGFQDRGAHYLRGDVAVVDPSITHSPVVDRGDPCVVLVAGLTASLPVTWLGRLVARFVKM